MAAGLAYLASGAHQGIEFEFERNIYASHCIALEEAELSDP